MTATTNTYLRRTTTSAETGTTVELYDARDGESVFDEVGGRWVTICVDHGDVVNHPTLDLANRWLRHSETWCVACADEWIEGAERIDGAPITIDEAASPRAEAECLRAGAAMNTTESFATGTRVRIIDAPNGYRTLIGMAGTVVETFVAPLGFESTPTERVVVDVDDYHYGFQTLASNVEAIEVETYCDCGERTAPEDGDLCGSCDDEALAEFVSATSAVVTDVDDEDAAPEPERIVWKVRVRRGREVQSYFVTAADASEAINLARPDVNDGTIASVSVAR